MLGHKYPLLLPCAQTQQPFTSHTYSIFTPVLSPPLHVPDTH